MSELQDKINKRRTFAIISHPDAGKTTLTEKTACLWGRYPSCRIGQEPQNKSSRRF